MREIIHRAQHFKPEASHARDGIAVIFDIAGFSQFFNQPDVHSYIPKYLNHIIHCVEISIFGGKTSWGHKDVVTPLPILPNHRKFLGDGMLYVFAPVKSRLLDITITNLTNRLWNIQNEFKSISNECFEFVPMGELPKGIRFGLARGTIYELSVEKSKEREYIGVCINLASRLQKYCSGLNFIASARLNLPGANLTKHGYMKIIATQIKGFPKEIVIVDKMEYARLDKDIKANYFMELPKPAEGVRPISPAQ